MITLPTFNDKALCCAHCGYNYTHHDKVEVYDRNEDAAKGLLVVVEASKATVDTAADMTDCPSSRRHGLRIHFWCEGCNGRSVLTVVQHKGCTHLHVEAA